MKSKAAVVALALSLITICTFTMTGGCQNSPECITMAAVNNTTDNDSYRNCTAVADIATNDTNDFDYYQDSPTDNTSITIEILQEIDNRVELINERIDQKWYEEHYDGDTVMYRHFDQRIYHEWSADYNDDGNATYRYLDLGEEGEEAFALYNLYYDEYGKLIFADIVHYRSTMYSIYFDNDQLYYVELGSYSYDAEPFINGGISNVQIAIAEDPRYSFVLEDLAFCLSHAYLLDSGE